MFSAGQWAKPNNDPIFKSCLENETWPKRIARVDAGSTGKLVLFDGDQRFWFPGNLVPCDPPREDWRAKWQEKDADGDEIVLCEQRSNGEWQYVYRDKERLDVNSVLADGKSVAGKQWLLPLAPPVPEKRLRPWTADDLLRLGHVIFCVSQPFPVWSMYRFDSTGFVLGDEREKWTFEAAAKSFLRYSTDAGKTWWPCGVEEVTKEAGGAG